MKRLLTDDEEAVRSRFNTSFRTCLLEKGDISHLEIETYSKTSKQTYISDFHVLN